MDEVEELLRQFSLQVLSVSLHAQTHHCVYKVICVEGEFILRVQPLSTQPRLEREAAHLVLLAKRGLSVPTLVSTTAGSPFAITRGAVGLLMHVLAGERVTPQAVDAPLMARVGGLLATLHANRLPQNTTSEAQALFGEGGFYPLDDLRRRLHAQQQASVERVWRLLESTLAVVGDCLLHGDVVLHNMLVSTERVSLVDWEYTRAGDARWDLASLLWQVRPRADWPTLQAVLLDAYSRAGGMPVEGLEAWLAARQLASLHWVAHNRALVLNSDNVIDQRLRELLGFAATGHLARA